MRRRCARTPGELPRKSSVVARSIAEVEASARRALLPSPLRGGQGGGGPHARRFARRTRAQTGMRGVRLIASGANEKVVRDREAGQFYLTDKPTLPAPQFLSLRQSCPSSKRQSSKCYRHGLL